MPPSSLPLQMAVGFTNEGTNLFGEPLYDKLFIVTPEEELTEFEKKLWEVLKSEGSPIGPIEKFTDSDKEVFHSYAAKLLAIAREQFIKDGYVIEKKAFHDAVEKVAPEVMKKVSENVNKMNDELTEFERRFFEIIVEIVEEKDNECSHPLEYAKELLSLARKELIEEQYTSDPRKTDLYKLGKAEALKDLPRWRKCADADRLNSYLIKPWIVRFDNDIITDSSIIHHGHYLCFADLEKLPGFKEDESHE